MGSPGAARFCDEERGPLELVEERLHARIAVKGEHSFHLEQYEIIPEESGG
jgi:hypothetical protein